MYHKIAARKSLAALANFFICAVNASIAWVSYNEGTSFYGVNIVFSIFSGVLALGNFFGYLEAKDRANAEDMYNEVYGRRR